MPQAQRTGRGTRFGPFELDRTTGELRKHGIKVRLQGKPFQLLIALLDRAGEIVSREELRQRLWSDDTFVDFESGLNTAANRLRIALGDAADNPRYVETLARSGYRFIAPVEEPSEAEPEPSPEPAAAVVTEYSTSAGLQQAPPPVSQSQSARWPRAVLAVTALCAGLGAVGWLAPMRGPADIQLRQITFRRGVVQAARFTPDGAVVYAARWVHSPKQIFLANALSPESRTLGFSDTNLAAVSASGELALIQFNKEKTTDPPVVSRVPMNGGAPLQLATAVSSADWSADGAQLAVIRHTETLDKLEYPIGTTLYQSSGILTDARISPQGNAIAFFEHPFRGDDGGDLKLADLQGHVKTLSAGWASAGGVAWEPSGREVYFTAARQGLARSLHAVTRSGDLREVAKVPGTLILHDIAQDGRALVSRENRSLVMESWNPEEKDARDLSWFDWSNVVACSSSCDLVLFDESGEGGGPQYSTYLYRANTRETIRVGPGRAMALAPDGKSVITMANANHFELQILPVGVGQRLTVKGGNVEYQSVQYLPDGKSIVIIGQERDKPLQLYLQDLSGGAPRALRVGVQPFWIAVSPDGKWTAGRSREGKLITQSLDGAQTRVLTTDAPVYPIRWARDGKEIFGIRFGPGFSNEIVRVDVATGQCKSFHVIKPADSEGTVRLGRVAMADDGKPIVYSYHRSLSELYIASGWIRGESKGRVSLP